MILAIQDYVSIISILIVIGFIIALFVGYKVGFLTNFLGVAKKICGPLLAILLCGPFANNCLYPWFGDEIEAKLTQNILTNIETNEYGETMTSTEILKELGVPNFLAEGVATKVEADTGTSLAESIANNLGETMAKFIVVVIAFFSLIILMSLVILILKLVVKGLREGSKVVKVLDGILGVIFCGLLFYLCVSLVGFVVMLMSQADFFQTPMAWLTNDMKLNTDDFRISKWLYENNIIGNFFKIFFSI